MLARKCDKCGVFYEMYGDGSILNNDMQANAIRFINVDKKGRISNMKAFDLCPKCMELMQRFINNEIEELGSIYVYPSNEQQSNK